MLGEKGCVDSKAFMIAICGRSGTGKTSFAKLIKKMLGEENVATVCLDDYHKYDREERKKLGITPLNPEANKIELIEEHLERMKRMESFSKPVYDHTQGKIIEDGEVFKPKPIVVVEGLLPLYTERMRRIFDLSIFIELDHELWLKWKLRRDEKERGYKQEFDLEAREKDYGLYILPQKRFADIVLSLKEKEGMLQAKLKFSKNECKNKDIKLPLKLFIENSVENINRYSLKAENGKLKIKGMFPKECIYEKRIKEKISDPFIDSFLLAQVIIIDYIIEKVKYENTL